MHIILTGATGLVGSAALLGLMGMKNITKISVLSRRPIPMLEEVPNDRVEVIIHDDFAKYDSQLLDRLKDANGCVWALGISQNQVGKEEYIHITKTMTLEAAKAFRQMKPDSEKFRFVFVSGEGVTRDPGFLTPLFGRVKGETETALIEMEKAHPNFRSIIIRPGVVDSYNHEELKRWRPPSTVAERLVGPILRPIFRNGIKSQYTPTAPLGTFLAGLATGSWDKELKGDGIALSGDTPTISNSGFRRLMRL